MEFRGVDAPSRGPRTAQDGLDVVTLLDCQTLAPDSTRHVLNFVFRGEIRGGELCLGGELGWRKVVEVGWQPLAGLPELPMHPHRGSHRAAGSGTLEAVVQF